MRRTAACSTLAVALFVAGGTVQTSMAQYCPQPSTVKADSGAYRSTATHTYSPPTGRRIYGAASRHLLAAVAPSQYEIAKPRTASVPPARIYGAATEHLAARTTVSRRTQAGYSFGYSYSPYWHYYRPWYFAPYRYPYYYGSYRPWYGFYGHRPYGYIGYRPFGYSGYHPYYGHLHRSYYGNFGYYNRPTTYFYARPYTYSYYDYGGGYYW